MDHVEIWHPGLVLPPEKLSPDFITVIKGSLSPVQTLALTAWAEARARLDRGRWIDNPIDAMVDIMNVVDNRVKDPRWSKLGHKRVCLQKRQFTCWEARTDDPKTYDKNFKKLIVLTQELLAGHEMDTKVEQCLAAAEGCLAAALVDSLEGACHYFADWLKEPPKWSFHAKSKLVAHRFGHLFFSGVP